MRPSVHPSQRLRAWQEPSTKPIRSGHNQEARSGTEHAMIDGRFMGLSLREEVTGQRGIDLEIRALLEASEADVERTKGAAVLSETSYALSIWKRSA